MLTAIAFDIQQCPSVSCFWYSRVPVTQIGLIILV